MAATIEQFCGWRNCARKLWPLEHVKGSLSSTQTASDVATEVHELPNEPLKFGLGQTAWMKPPTLTSSLLLPYVLFSGTGANRPIETNGDLGPMGMLKHLKCTEIANLHFKFHHNFLLHTLSFLSLLP